MHNQNLVIFLVAWFVKSLAYQIDLRKPFENSITKDPASSDWPNVSFYYEMKYNDTKLPPGRQERHLTLNFEMSRSLCMKEGLELFSPSIMLEENYRLLRNAEYWIEYDETAPLGQCWTYFFDDGYYDEDHDPTNEWEYRLDDCRKRKFVICQWTRPLLYENVVHSISINNHTLGTWTMHQYSYQTWDNAKHLCSFHLYTNEGKYWSAPRVITLGLNHENDPKLLDRVLDPNREYWARKGDTGRISFKICWYIKIKQYVNGTTDWVYDKDSCKKRKYVACQHSWY